MIVHKYIVHVLDRNSEGPILNDFEGKNNMEVDKFFEKVINKVTKDDAVSKSFMMIVLLFKTQRK